MLEGRCRNCGIYRIGWALRYLRYQICPNCGGGLEITENGHSIPTGYSPFDVEEYFINPRTDAPPPRDKEQWKAG